MSFSPRSPVRIEFPPAVEPRRARIAGVILTAICGTVLLVFQTAIRAADDAAAAPAAAPRFETDILPIFKARCLHCHAAGVKKGELDLSTLAAALRGGESGAVIAPGKPDDSLLYEMVHEGTMPADKKGRLTETEVALIGRWIKAGASGDGPPGKQASAAEPTEDDVIPILLRRCTVCHGVREQSGGLDLRNKAAMLKGGKSGPAIVPGHPDDSRLIQRIRSHEMPPLRRVVEVSIKPIEDSETRTIARWIELGAPEVTELPDVATTSPDPLVSDDDRKFWAFQTPRQIPPPAAPAGAHLKNPVDAFVVAQLTARGLPLSPPVDRAALARRVSLDLTGVPPEPAEIEAFLADLAPDAYEQLVDRLLASRRYGERWARHWLDLAGYADSEGKTEQDLTRPTSYRYRDYVIRSLNADKPYDRFLIEQLAGDELQDYEHASVITPEIYDNIVATGFLRMAPDGTWANITAFVPDRMDVIADEIDIVSSGLFGMTFKCARCHTHKFDPIPQRDYYRLWDVFKGAYDEHDWLKPGSVANDKINTGTRGERRLPFASTAERLAWEKQSAELQAKLDPLKATLATQEAALKAGPEDAAAKKAVEETKRQIQTLESSRVPEPAIRALWDRGEPSPTYILRRGEYLTPGRRVGPGVPSVLTDGRTPFDVQPPWPGARQTGRRLAFARWLTQPDHPLTARVIVNRVWRHHFGRGIVKTLGNFGKTGAAPTHPELLDWLAVEFMRQGWSFKKLHRLLVTSATYQQSSHVSDDAERLDPDNLLLSRMPLRRMEADVLYDSLLLVAGQLDETPYGPADKVQIRPDGLVTPPGTDRGWRRGVYVEQRRKYLPTLFENFDQPQMNPNCLERSESTVAPQALQMMNDGLIRKLSEHFASRVARIAAEPEQQIDQAYRLALGRPPDAEERAAALEALLKLNAAAGVAGASSTAPGAPAPGLAPFCQALLNSAAFVYID